MRITLNAVEENIAPLGIRDRAISLIINGEIIHYHYDKEREEIILKEALA